MEKRYNFTQVEGEIRQFWEQEGIHRFDKDADGEVYSIDTPPPTINGSLHIGHIFSYTQAEMIARFRRMQGYNVFYPFGFDDNGLPTERLVERDEGIRAGDMPRSEFIDRCVNTTKRYEAEFKELLNSVGFSVDWSLQYETVSPSVRKISQELFLELVTKGKAYEKSSPVLWCTECQTSIAQAELDTAELESTFNYIPFIVDGVRLEVATTRPELLYGCVCLFVNPDDKRYANFVGKNAIVPLYNYEIPILTDSKVSLDKGTGVVMCATFGDTTDVEWYKEHNLEYRKVILPDGRIDNDVPFIGGLKVKAARLEIIRLLSERQLLLKQETITHATPIHERCGKEIEIIPSRQWYIDILTDKQRYLQAADEINWYPQQMKSRYIAWVENIKWDWCISRQRYFGVPFPVWYCKDCGTAVFARRDQLPINPLETAYEGECGCGCREFVAESAVFDTWATSSITPQINERLGLELTPMSMRTHAHEIIRTWTFYTIVRSLYHTGKLPWKDLMISGFVLAKKGEKISKSKNNSILDPKQLIQIHSADSIRYWVAGTKLGTDTFFSEDELQISKRFITKLWNACRFSLSHLEDIEVNHKPTLLPVDRWIIARTNQTIARVTKLLNQYEVGLARQEIDELFWNDLCDNYLEIAKERLYRPDLHGAHQRRSGQYALYYTILNILKLYAIYVPYITDHIYRCFFNRFEGKGSIHQLRWENPNIVEDDILEFGNGLKEVLSNMRRYKSQNNLSMRAEMDCITIDTKKHLADYFIQTKMDITACTSAKRIEILSN